MKAKEDQGPINLKGQHQTLPDDLSETERYRYPGSEEGKQITLPPLEHDEIELEETDRNYDSNHKLNFVAESETSEAKSESAMLSDHSKTVTPLPLAISIPHVVVLISVILVAVETVLYLVEPPSIWKTPEMAYVVA